MRDFELSGGGRLYGPWPIVLYPMVRILTPESDLRVVSTRGGTQVLTPISDTEALLRDVVKIPREPEVINTGEGGRPWSGTS